jgi:hypothetical protein
MSNGTRPYQKFLSDSCIEQQRLLPLAAALIFGWTIAGASFVMSLWILPFNLPGGLVLFIATTLFVMRLYTYTHRMGRDNGFRYEFVITKGEAILFAHDPGSDKQLIESVILQQVSLAEVFRYGQLCTLTLISPGRNLQIPLSQFQSCSDEILRALYDNGISIVSLNEEAPRVAA